MDDVGKNIINCLAVIAERAAHEILATDGHTIGLIAPYRALTEPAKGFFLAIQKHSPKLPLELGPTPTHSLLTEAQHALQLHHETPPSTRQWVDFFRQHPYKAAKFIQITTAQSGGGATYKHAIVTIPAWTEFTTQQPQSIVATSRVTGIMIIAAPMRNLPANCWIARI